MMRTTLSLDPDVAAQLAQIRERDTRSFKKLVNDLLRSALAASDRPKPRATGPPTLPVSGGRPLLPNVDDVGAVLALIEGEDHK